MTHALNSLAVLGMPPGLGETLVILVVLLLIFGKRLPDMGRSMGRGIVEFKKGLKGETNTGDDAETEVKPAAKQPPRQIDGESVKSVGNAAPREKTATPVGERRD